MRAPSTCAPDTERIHRRSGGWWAASPRTIRVYARRAARPMSSCLARPPTRSIQKLRSGKRLRIITASGSHRFRPVHRGSPRAWRSNGAVPGRAPAAVPGQHAAAAKRAHIHIRTSFRVESAFFVDRTARYRYILPPQAFQAVTPMFWVVTQAAPVSLCSFLDRHAW